MGVLNVTPDSFSDGGQHLDPTRAVERAWSLAAEGAAVVDLGAESTRPGAAPVPPEEQLRRLLPVLERLREGGFATPISVDTRSGQVARAALRAGAALVNDVSCLADPDLAAAAAEVGALLVISHIRGTPADMQHDPRYADPVAEVERELLAARARAERAGLAAERVLLDPGIGFGKRLEHNLRLLAAGVPRLAAYAPVVVGVSRKAMLGQLLARDGEAAPRPVQERLAGGLGAAVFAALRGARLVRTHDVAPTVDALRVAWALEEARRAGDADGEAPRVA
jgi:dihydropteroate synthase